MAQTYTVTGETSLVSVDNIQSPYTLVYISTSIYPGHIVGIRDITGDPLIKNYPIVLSTLNGTSFFDGTFSTIIDTPNSNITLTSLTYNKWQILNNIGFLNTISTIYLNQLTGENGLFSIVSSVYDVVSTINATQINISRSLTINGNTIIAGNIDIYNTVLFESSLTVNENVSISSSLDVLGKSFLNSTVHVHGNITVYENVSTYQDLIIGDNIYISTTLFTNSAKIQRNIQISELLIDEINNAGGSRFYGDTIVGSNMYIGEDLIVNKVADIRKSFIIKGETKIYDNLDINGNANLANIYIGSTVATTGDLTVQGNAYIQNGVAIENNVFINSSTFIKEHVSVEGDVSVENVLEVHDVYIDKNAYVSSFITLFNLGIGDNLYISNNLFASGSTVGYSTLGAGKDIHVLYGNSIFNNNLSTLYNFTVNNDMMIKSSINILGATVIGSNIEYASTSLIEGTVSTINMDIQGNMYVGDTLTVKKYISAPIFESLTSTVVSTLVLSDSLEANIGYIPYFFGNQLPPKIFVGEGVTTNYPQDYYINRVFYISSSINQEGYETRNEKMYNINSIKASSILIPNILSTFIVGDSNYTNGSNIRGKTAIINTEAIFQTFISSAWLSANKIYGSSFTGKFIGEGFGIKNATLFNGPFNISSLTASNIYTTDISGDYLLASNAIIRNNLVINKYNFISTQTIWLAAGDNSTRANIQKSLNINIWKSDGSNNFQYYSKAITGNSNINAPLFVATGADSRFNYTLQWSSNNGIWYPATSGGFPNGIGNVLTGNGIAYLNPNRWVAVGLDSLNTHSTILYSTDGSNWSAVGGTNAFRNEGINIRIANNTFMTSGFDAANSNNNIIKYSGNGTSWSNATIDISAGNPILSFAYGTLDFGEGNLQNGWIAGASNGRTYYSVDNGSNWTVSVDTNLRPFGDIYWNGSIWVAVGSNVIKYSATGFSWTNALTSFDNSIVFKAVSFNSNQNTWVAGAQNSNTSLNTLWYSSNANTWTRILEGGFSTAVITAGIGYSIITTPANSTITAGTGSLTGTAYPEAQIYNILYDSNVNNYITSTSLIQAGVFSTVVRSIGYNSSEEYPFVAVGDGAVPQKTIGRARTENGPWLPAITGGFSTGYGVVHYNDDIWLAVGEATISTNNIQYSTDGTNWYGTNSNANAVLRLGGRGIATGDIAGSPTAVIATGRDTVPTYTIGLTSNGYDWIPVTVGGFNVQGNSICKGEVLGAPVYVATGIDSAIINTIQYSVDGFTWIPAVSGGFTGGGNGVYYKNLDGQDIFLALGNVNNTTQSATNYTIQYSSDGSNFIPTTNAFTKQGFSATYNSFYGVFFAVGEDLNAINGATIKYSTDGITWFNIDSNSGFKSEISLGATYGLYSQSLASPDIYSYLDFPKLIIYEKDIERNYNKASIRLQSSLMYLNEAIQINLSSQLTINGTNPIQDTLLTVYGDIYASSLVYNGGYSNDNIFSADLLTTSTLYATDQSLANSIQLSTHLYIGPTNRYPAVTERVQYRNKILFQSAFDPLNPILSNVPPSNAILNLNDTMYLGLASQKLPYGSNVQTIAINNISSSYALDVSGSIGSSTLSTKYVMASLSIAVSPTQIFPLITSNILFYTSTSFFEPARIIPGNTIECVASTITLSKIIDINLSTQRIGMFSRNPLFPFEVSREVISRTMSTNILRASTFFLTIQSI